MKKLFLVFWVLPLLLIGPGSVLIDRAFALDGKCGAKLYPVDEASKDPSFFAFRQRLLRAVENRDHQFIASILDSKILNDFGGASGAAAFQKKWNPKQVNSPLWSVLKSILTLGGTFEKDENQQTQFIAPYVFSRWCIPMDCEGCDYGAMIDKESKLRAKPNGAVITELRYDVVKIEGEGNAEASSMGGRWLQVSTLKGQKGYVPSKSIRSPTDYRASFAKIQGEWKMTTLVSGD